MKRTKYNPREPVTIHNPYPQKLWPFREGTLVWYIYDNAYAQIRCGRMRFYNPGLESTCLINKGQPICTVDTTGGSAQTVTLDEIAPRTKAGKKKLLLYLAGRRRASAAACLLSMQRQLRAAQELEDEAEKL